MLSSNAGGLSAKASGLRQKINRVLNRVFFWFLNRFLNPGLFGKKTVGFRWKKLFSFGGCVFQALFFLSLWVYFFGHNSAFVLEKDPAVCATRDVILFCVSFGKKGGLMCLKGTFSFLDGFDVWLRVFFRFKLLLRFLLYIICFFGGFGLFFGFFKPCKRRNPERLVKYKTACSLAH